MGTGAPSFLLPIPFLFPSWRETSPSSYSCSLSDLIPVCGEEILTQDVVPPPPSLPTTGFVRGIDLEKKEAKERSGSKCVWGCVHLELALIQHQAKVQQVLGPEHWVPQLWQSWRPGMQAEESQCPGLSASAVIQHSDHLCHCLAFVLLNNSHMKKCWCNESSFGVWWQSRKNSKVSFVCRNNTFLPSQIVMLENMMYFCVHRHPCSNSSKLKSSFDGEDHAEVTCNSLVQLMTA